MKNKDIGFWLALGAIAYLIAQQHKKHTLPVGKKPLLSDRRVEPVEQSIGYYKRPSYRMNI